jgi:hypothetical protein
MHTEWPCQNAAIFGAISGGYHGGDQVIAAPRGFSQQRGLTIRRLQFHIKTLS